MYVCFFRHSVKKGGPGTGLMSTYLLSFELSVVTQHCGFFRYKFGLVVNFVEAKYLPNCVLF